MGFAWNWGAGEQPIEHFLGDSDEQEMISKDRWVTIPMDPKKLARPDRNDFIRDAEEAGHDVRAFRPMSRRAERVFIAAIALAMVGGMAIAFTRGNYGTEIGLFLGGMSIAVVAALLWAHLRGGIDQSGQTVPNLPGESHHLRAPRSNALTIPQVHVQLASFPRRSIAFIIDLPVSFFPLFCVAAIGTLDVVGGAVMTMLWVASLAGLVLFPASVVWLTNGRSPGKMLLGLRIVRTNGQPLTYGIAVKREFWRFVMQGLPSMLATIPAAATDRFRRSEADDQADTIVIVQRSKQSGGQAESMETHRT